MGDGVQVPLDKIENTAEQVGVLAKRGQDLATRVGVADPGAGVWGVGLGLLLKQFYDPKHDEAERHVQLIGEALTSQSDAIRAAGEAHKAVDEAIAKAFQKVVEALGGGK